MHRAKYLRIVQQCKLLVVYCKIWFVNFAISLRPLCLDYLVRISIGKGWEFTLHPCLHWHNSSISNDQKNCYLLINVINVNFKWPLNKMFYNLLCNNFICNMISGIYIIFHGNDKSEIKTDNKSVPTK